MARSLLRPNAVSPPGLPLLLAFAAAALAAIALRYGLMESDALHAVCASANEDWRCDVRRWAPQLFIQHRIGWLALAAGVLALPTGNRLLANIAVVGGAAGLVLYSADYAAAGLLLGLIARLSPRSRKRRAG